jgi:hypothetical protein
MQARDKNNIDDLAQMPANGLNIFSSFMLCYLVALAQRGAPVTGEAGSAPRTIMNEA